MTPKFRIALAALAFCAATTSSTSVFAWGCAAVSEEGTYGYSYSYADEDSARERALTECANRTTTNGTCEITECEEGS